MTKAKWGGWCCSCRVCAFDSFGTDHNFWHYRFWTGDFCLCLGGQHSPDRCPLCYGRVEPIVVIQMGHHVASMATVNYLTYKVIHKVLILLIACPCRTGTRGAVCIQSGCVSSTAFAQLPCASGVEAAVQVQYQFGFICPFLPLPTWTMTSTSTRIVQ